MRRSHRAVKLLLLQLLYLFSTTIHCLPGREGHRLVPRRIFHAAMFDGSRAGFWQGGWISGFDSMRYRSSQAVPTTRTTQQSLILFASDNDEMNSSIATSWMNRKNFIAAAVSLILSSSILLEIYSRIGTLFINDGGPTDRLLPTLLSASSVQHATIVFHGSGGQDSYTDALMERLRKENPSQYNQIVDWSQYSTNILQASYNGERIGQRAANELIDLLSPGSLQTIHLIGISVGSFAADAASREIKNILDSKTTSPPSSRPFVQLTLLDPFTQRGIFGLGYGNRVFGTTADYTQQYLNTDDPVPSTNAPLQNSVCYDITNLRPDEIFGHDWPVAYYGKSNACGKVMTQKDQQQEEGTVVVL
jgi:Lipase